MVVRLLVALLLFALFFSVCLLSSFSAVTWAIITMLPDANKWMDGKALK